MKRAIRLRPQVVDDLTQAMDWYNARCDQLGEDFIREAYNAFDVIAERAESFPMMHKQVRRALMKRFPYAIYFGVERETVIIFVVIHTARSPRNWKRRLR